MSRNLALVRLMQLVSPALPVGAYTYSQGLETAAEDKIVHDEESARSWIEGLLQGPMGCFEAPVTARLYMAWANDDFTEALRLNREFLASRDTAELRAETIQMGYSLKRLAVCLPDIALHAVLEKLEETAFPTVYTAMASAWNVGCPDTVTGYLWSWCENQVVAAVKTVPLGQTTGQRILVFLGSKIPAIVETALNLPENRWSTFAPGLAIASSRHETQYARLFRS